MKDALLPHCVWLANSSGVLVVLAERVGEGSIVFVLLLYGSSQNW